VKARNLQQTALGRRDVRFFACCRAAIIPIALTQTW